MNIETKIMIGPDQSTQSSNIISHIFKSDIIGNNELRIIGSYDNPLFIAKDIAMILGYSNTNETIKKHVDEEDKIRYKVGEKIGGSESLPLKIQDGTILINESGLYSLILRSKMDKAKHFKRWVTSEILPAIRKTGQFKIDELQIKLLEKEHKLSKLQEAHNRLVYKRNRHKLKKGRCCYVLVNPNNPNDKKIGKTTNMNVRTTTYSTYFEPYFLYVIFTEDNDLLEKCIKKRYKLTKEWIENIDIEELITTFELFANELKLDYTAYRNIEDLKVEEESDEEDETEDIKEEIIEEDIKLVKHCNNCNSDLDFSAFNKDSSKEDGFHTICRACEKVNKMAYKNKNKEKVVITEKECAICLEVKQVSKFSEHKYTSDGYVRQCFDCMNKITNDKRQKDKESNVRYKCGNCNKDYARKDTLTKHQKTCK